MEILSFSLGLLQVFLGTTSLTKETTAHEGQEKATELSRIQVNHFRRCDQNSINRQADLGLAAPSMSIESLVLD